MTNALIQGGHLSGKPENVGNLVANRGNVWVKFLSGGGLYY